MSNNSRLAEPYQRKIGKVTFVVSSFGNPKSTRTADELILQMLENRINNSNERSLDLWK